MLILYLMDNCPLSFNEGSFSIIPAVTNMRRCFSIDDLCLLSLSAISPGFVCSFEIISRISSLVEDARAERNFSSCT